MRVDETRGWSHDWRSGMPEGQAQSMNAYVKFGAVVVVVIGVLVWLAVGGNNESKSYFKTISELRQMGDQAQIKLVRVDGFVQAGSIVRNGAEVSFVIHQDPNKRAQDGMA